MIDHDKLNAAVDGLDGLTRRVDALVSQRRDRNDAEEISSGQSYKRSLMGRGGTSPEDREKARKSFIDRESDKFSSSPGRKAGKSAQIEHGHFVYNAANHAAQHDYHKEMRQFHQKRSGDPAHAESAAAHGRAEKAHGEALQHNLKAAESIRQGKSDPGARETGAALANGAARASRAAYRTNAKFQKD